LVLPPERVALLSETQVLLVEAVARARREAAEERQAEERAEEERRGLIRETLAQRRSEDRAKKERAIEKLERAVYKAPSNASGLGGVGHGSANCKGMVTRPSALNPKH